MDNIFRNADILRHYSILRGNKKIWVHKFKLSKYRIDICLKDLYRFNKPFVPDVHEGIKCDSAQPLIGVLENSPIPLIGFLENGSMPLVEINRINNRLVQKYHTHCTEN